MIEGFLNIDGVLLRAREKGDGMPVLLTPGGPGCCDYLAPVAGMMEQHARVIRWEPRGCGESDQVGPYDVATTLADMDRIRELYGFEQWIVGGHSQGAFHALAYALTYPQHTQGVVYLSGRGLLRDQGWHIEYSDKRDLVGELEPEYAFPHNMEVNRVGTLSEAEWCRDPMLLKNLSELTVPLMAIQGGKDIRPGWPVEQLVNLLPNASMVTLPDAGHALWLTHAETLKTMLNAFLGGFRTE